MSDPNTLELAAIRRVATRAGALRFNRAIGTIIGSEGTDDTTPERSATLTRLLSLYNRMRAAKLYGNDAAFKSASAEMADAINNYSKKHPGAADRLRDVIQKLTFTEEETAARTAASARTKNETNAKTKP